MSSTGEVNLDFGKTGVLGSRTDLGDLYLDPFGSDSLGEVDRETSRSVVGKSAERDSSSIAESDDTSENLISEVGSIPEDDLVEPLNRTPSESDPRSRFFTGRSPFLSSVVASSGDVSSDDTVDSSFRILSGPGRLRRSGSRSLESEVGESR